MEYKATSYRPPSPLDRVKYKLVLHGSESFLGFQHELFKSISFTYLPVFNKSRKASGRTMLSLFCRVLFVYCYHFITFYVRFETHAGNLFALNALFYNLYYTGSNIELSKCVLLNNPILFFFCFFCIGLSKEGEEEAEKEEAEGRRRATGREGDKKEGEGKVWNRRKKKKKKKKNNNNNNNKKKKKLKRR